MQTRSLGIVALVLFGAYVIIEGVMGILRLPIIYDDPAFPPFWAWSLASLAGLFIGGLIIAFRHGLASFLFPADEPVDSSVPQTELLAAGLCVLGVWWLCTIPWNLISNFVDSVPNSYWSTTPKGPMVADVVLMIIAANLILRSHKISTWLCDKAAKA